MAATTLWSDQEKLALLLSITRHASPTINWKGIDLPQGRTLQSAQKMYSRLLESAADVPMVTSEAVAQLPKRPRRPNKKHRAKKAIAGEKEDSNGAADMDEGKVRPCKRVKLEKKGVAEEEGAKSQGETREGHTH